MTTTTNTTSELAHFISDKVFNNDNAPFYEDSFGIAKLLINRNTNLHIKDLDSVPVGKTIRFPVGINPSNVFNCYKTARKVSTCNWEVLDLTPI